MPPSFFPSLLTFLFCQVWVILVKAVSRTELPWGWLQLWAVWNASGELSTCTLLGWKCYVSSQHNFLRMGRRKERHYLTLLFWRDLCNFLLENAYFQVLPPELILLLSKQGWRTEALLLVTECLLSARHIEVHLSLSAISTHSALFPHFMHDCIKFQRQWETCLGLLSL